MAARALLGSDLGLRRNSVIGRSARTRVYWVGADRDNLSTFPLAPLPVFPRLPRSPGGLRRPRTCASMACRSSLRRWFSAIRDPVADLEHSEVEDLWFSISWASNGTMLSAV